MLINVQQQEVTLIDCKSKMMTQFQEMLTLLKSAQNVQSAPIPANQNNINFKTKKNNKANPKTSITSTAGHMQAVLILARNATASLRVTQMMQPSPSCLEVHPLAAIGYKNDRLGSQIV